MSENLNVTTQEKTLPFFGIIIKNIWLIVIITVLCGGLFFGYTMLNKQSTTHTANCSIIISTKMNEGAPEKDVLYTQLYLSTFKNIAESTTLAKTADKYYQENENYTQSGSINRNNFSFVYGGESLIVKVAYVDVDEVACQEKLDAYITVIEQELKENAIGAYINSKEVSMVRLQEDFVVNTNNATSRNALTGIVVGLVVAVAIAFIKYFIGDKVNGVDDLEEITKAKTLATLK